MDYAKPADVVASMVDASLRKLALRPRDLLIRGVLSAGMLLGAKVSLADWWMWNQIPVTLGNLVGGFLFTGLALYATHRPAEPSSAAAQVAATAQIDSKVLAS